MSSRNSVGRLGEDTYRLLPVFGKGISPSSSAFAVGSTVTKSPGNGRPVFGSMGRTQPASGVVVKLGSHSVKLPWRCNVVGTTCRTIVPWRYERHSSDTKKNVLFFSV